MHGFGSKTQKNGDYFCGQWLNGSRVFCEQYKARVKYDDKIYEGHMLNHKRHGRGTLENPDGSVFYKGDFNNDEKHGEGILKKLG